MCIVFFPQGADYGPAKRSWACLRSGLHSAEEEVDTSLVNQLRVFIQVTEVSVALLDKVAAGQRATVAHCRARLAESETRLDSTVQIISDFARLITDQEIETVAAVNAYRNFRLVQSPASSGHAPASSHSEANLPASTLPPPPTTNFVAPVNSVTIASLSSGTTDDDLVVTFTINGRTMTFTETRAFFEKCEATIAHTWKESASIKYRIADLKNDVTKIIQAMEETRRGIEGWKELARLASACVEAVRVKQPDLVPSEPLTPIPEFLKEALGGPELD